MLPLRSLVGDALDDLLSLDNRLFRTLGPLLVRPGRLTAEYLAGRRARFIPPFRLYLLVSLLYFGVLSMVGSNYFFFVQLSSDDAQTRQLLNLLPRVMFVIVPGFALLLQLLYWRGRLFVEHLVFALHFFAFACLVLSAYAFIEAYVLAEEPGIFSGPLMVVGAALQIWVFAGLYLSLRRVYGGPHWLTAIRMVALLAGYLGLLVITARAVVALGLS